MKLELAGAPFEVLTKASGIERQLRRDFPAAPVDAAPVFRFRACVRPLPRRTAGGIVVGRARFLRWNGRTSALVYFGETLVIFRFDQRRALVVGPHVESTYAVLSLVVQSAIGELFDLCGYHRVHASAVRTAKGPVLFLGTSGRGKSSHARAFQSRGAEVLADDTTFLAGDGRVVPCALPIKLRAPPADSDALEPAATARGEARFVVRLRTLATDTEPLPLRFVLLEKPGDERPELRPSNRLRLFALLLRWLVVGHELPQMWELFVRPSFLDVGRKVAIGFARLRFAMRIALRSRLWRLAAQPGSEHAVARTLSMEFSTLTAQAATSAVPT